jgi:hypothetical protein
MIARALAYTQPPTLPGEEWLEIRNPFILGIGDDEIKFFAGQMQKKHGVSIVIPDRQFQIVNGVLTDPAAEQEERPTLAIQRPGERWRLVDLREFTGGTVHLVQSEADRRWGVQIVWNEDRPSYITWYNNETQAHGAFAQNI